MSDRAEMIGVKFTRLTPIEIVETESKRLHLIYRCQCDCGNVIEVAGYALRSGNTKSCGCIRNPNLIGMENEHGIVTRKIGNRMWALKCNYCGDEHIQNQREIRNNARSRQCETFKPSNYTGRNPKDNYLFRTYGITTVEYDEMLEAQNGVCAICGQEEQVKTRGLSVDHCHETGEVRGLLCSFCNMALGLFKDNPQSLINAVKYLAR